MLRLERRNRQEVSVTFGPGSSFWSRSLLIALAVAIGLHLFGFFLFRFKEVFHRGDRILPPTEVEIDLSQGFAAFVEKQHQVHYPFEPAPSPLKFPEMPMPISEQSSVFSHEAMVLNMPLGGWKENWDHLAPLEKDHETSNRVTVKAFGELAAIPIVSEHPLRLSTPSSEEYSSVYAVQVDAASGQVFWWMRQETTGLSIVDVEAEAILRDLRFQTDARKAIIAGYIEIRLGVGAS